jgi:TPR repeat protein
MSTLAVFALAAIVAAGSHSTSSEGTAQTYTKPLLTEPAALALNRARAAEQDGQKAEALRHYRTAAAAGSGEAAKRLGDAYWKGSLGADRDLAESMRWYREAELRGETVAQAMRMR